MAKEKYEKVNESTIKVTSENVQVIPIEALLGAKKQLKNQIKDLSTRLEGIKKLISEAKKLGIKVEEPKEK